MNFGLHINETTPGRFTFVGSIPADLMLYRKATREDVFGGRAFEYREWLVAPITPLFDSADAARAYAAEHGYTLRCRCCGGAA